MKNKIPRLLFISIFAAFQISSFAQNAGIGTANPLQKLHVEGTVYIKDSHCIGTAGSTTPYRAIVKSTSKN